MNDKNIVLQEIYKLNELFWKAPTQSPTGNNPSEKILEEMESLLMTYLEKYPQDTEIWLKLTMIEFTPPWEDYERIEKYITTILKYDENNVQALLILAYAQYIFRGEVTKDLLIRLQNISNITTDKELLSMIYLAIAWYYSKKDIEKYKQSLLRSISYCNKHVDNYESLGRLYLQTGRKAEGKKMIRCALANICKVYEEDYSSSDITDINRFFDEFFKMTYITRLKLDSMCELLE